MKPLFLYIDSNSGNVELVKASAEGQSKFEIIGGISSDTAENEILQHLHQSRDGFAILNLEAYVKDRSLKSDILTAHVGLLTEVMHYKVFLTSIVVDEDDMELASSLGIPIFRQDGEIFTSQTAGVESFRMSQIFDVASRELSSGDSGMDHPPLLER